jgi:DNA-binding NarL/FixJ family response regulator
MVSNPADRREITMTSSVQLRPAESTIRLSLVTDPDRLSRLRLNRRERDVLMLLAQGLSTREVAKQLCYSERTIKNVLQDVTGRLQLRNRTQAVAVAIRAGWI